MRKVTIIKKKSHSENIGGEKLLIANYNSVMPDNIARIIAEKGLKQCAVAKRAGFSNQQFNDMLNGRKIIKPCDALAISEALGVTMNELYKEVKKGEV